MAPAFSQCSHTALKKKLVLKSSIIKHLPKHGVYRGLSLKKKTNEDHQPKLTRQRSIRPSSNSNDFQPSSDSPLETIEEFYNCINSKNLNQIGEFISDDCCFDDYTFPEQFKGKKEVTQFFLELTEGMGKHVKFVTQSTCKSSDTVATMWHLEWNGKQIPFTRGCSYFECVKHGDLFVIKHAWVFIESPIKPKAIVLTLLKFVTYLFDEFPMATEKFLQRPHVVLQILMLWSFLYIHFRCAASDCGNPIESLLQIKFP